MEEINLEVEVPEWIRKTKELLQKDELAKSNKKGTE